MIIELSQSREMRSGGVTESGTQNRFWKKCKQRMWKGVEKKRKYASWRRFSRYAEQELVIHANVD